MNRRSRRWVHRATVLLICLGGAACVCQSDDHEAAAQEQGKTVISPREAKVDQSDIRLYFHGSDGFALLEFPELIVFGDTDQGSFSSRAYRWSKEDSGRLHYDFFAEEKDMTWAAESKAIEDGWILSLTVGNRSPEPWEDVVAVVCLRLNTSSDFSDKGWKRTYYRTGGEYLAYHGRKRGGGKEIYQMSLVKGRRQIRRSQRHQDKWGFTLKQSDDGIIAVVSEDGSTVLTKAFEPVHHLQANQRPSNYCIHANPYFGQIKPGTSKTIKGCILVTRGSLEEAWARTRKTLKAVTDDPT